MNFQRRTNPDGTMQVVLDISPDEHAALNEKILESGSLAMDGQKTCTCSNGKKHAVSNDPFEAFFQCLFKCGPGFSLS